MAQNDSSLRKNPSREICEGIIKRILMTEMLENGKNEHFRSASDFMTYFQSLYPASDALTKQVQRAVKALNMPKDDLGYFIPNKTPEQLDHEKEVKHLLKKAHASVLSGGTLEPVFMAIDASLISYSIHLIESSPLFKDKYIAMIPASNGILFLTDAKSSLEILINSLIES